MSWPLAFGLPFEGIEMAKLEQEIAALEGERRRALAPLPRASSTPLPKLEARSVLIASGLAALGSLLGARNAPAALARTLAAKEAQLNRAWQAEEGRRLEDQALALRQRSQEAALLGEEIDRRTRAADQLRTAQARKEENLARRRLAREEMDREEARKRDELEWKKSEALAEAERWKATAKRLEEAQALQNEDREARRALAEERLDLDRQKAETDRELGLARAETDRLRRLSAPARARGGTRDSDRRLPEGRSSRQSDQEKLLQLKDQKADLLRGLKDGRLLAENGRSSRYFWPRKVFWRDEENGINLRYEAEQTATGKAALRRLQALDARITALRDSLNQEVQAYDPLSHSGPPPAWAQGPIGVRPRPAPARQPAASRTSSPLRTSKP